MSTRYRVAPWFAGLFLIMCASTAQGQPFGVELHNTMMPASGAMGGVSIADPQDLLSALNGNPGTLTRFDGTQFQFGGGFAESTYDLTQTAALPVPGVTPFSGKSQTPAALVANIGLNQRFSLFGADANYSLGLISNAGGGIDFRNVPASNGTSSSILILDIAQAFAVRITPKFSVGANVMLGNAYFDGPFVGNSAMVNALALRGGVGANYDVTDATSLGVYWQSKQHFHFDDAISLQLFNGAFDVTRDVRMDLPTNVGFGIANRRLMNGRLLLASDILFKHYDAAELFGSIYRDQWVYQFGSQYSTNKLRLRAGYVYALNPVKPIVSTEAGGVVPPGGVNAVEFLQAQFAIINQHRISGGVGFVNVVPGLDVDFFAGGMLPASQQTGPFSAVSVKSYYLGLGATYRFGRMGTTKTAQL